MERGTSSPPMRTSISPPTRDLVFGADGINSEQIDLADYYSGALPEGRYRIVKEIYGAGADQYTAAEFTIGD